MYNIVRRHTRQGNAIKVRSYLRRAPGTRAPAPQDLTMADVLGIYGIRERRREGAKRRAAGKFHS